MARRIHVPTVRIGDNPLDSIQAHHARDVLRLPEGAEVDLFDNAGVSARGRLAHAADGSSVLVTQLNVSRQIRRLQWTVASAIPKGDRADWMVEKLSELGAAAFIPLAAARSVVLPEGKGKRDRWHRLATESAKQSRRDGVMRIDPLTPLQAATDAVRNSTGAGWCFATETSTIPMADAISAASALAALTLFIGPEGGWTPEELGAFQLAGIPAVRLGRTILRIESAAIAAGAVVAAMLEQEF